MEFLSDEWLKAANRALERLEVEKLELTVTLMTEENSHSIVLSNGRASVSFGAADSDVTIRQSASTAKAVREGSLSALKAIQDGMIEIDGDTNSLLAARETLEAIDLIFTDLEQ